MLRHLLAAFACAIWLLLPVEARAEEQPTPEQREFFEKRIRPLLAQNCFKCHGPKKQKASLRLDSRAAILAGGDSGPAIVPGKPDESELILAVSYDPNGFQMPPTGKLPDEAIADLRRWVEMGAPWPGDKPTTVKPADSQEWDLEQARDHWSFRPLAPVTPPKVPNAPQGWPQNPIDLFILARLRENGLQPAAPADRRTWLRRVSFDLIGLPPTPEQIREFLADDSPEAYERVVDRLLASPHYGERWGRHWLDLVRYAETAGHEFDYEIPHAWPYRDYVVRAFNADVPYFDLVREHVAGDLLPQPRRDPARGTNESVIATAFWWFSQGKHSPVDIRAEECDRLDNQIDVFSKTFLGLSVACARCHDHKFDPISQRDYYALSGILRSSRRRDAVIDAPEPTRRIIEALKQGDAGVESIRRKAAEQRLRNVLRAVIPQTDTHVDGDVSVRLAKDAPFHPLAPWLTLRNTDAAEFAQRRADILEAWRERARVAAERRDDVVFATFDAGRWPDGWQVDGPAFGERPTSVGDLSPLSEADGTLEPIAPGLAHSGLVAARLEGALRSPTFVIPRRYVHIRMCRRPGTQKPRSRPLKNGQAHLIIDGFHFIRDPIYGGLSLRVKEADEPVWHRQDVSKWVGEEAYFEFLDEDDGRLIIDRIVFSDNPEPPPDAPNPLVIDLLADPGIASADQFGVAVRRVIDDTLVMWREGSLPDAADSAARIELLCGLADVTVPSAALATGSLSETDKRALSEWAEQRRRLEAALPRPMRSVAMTDGTGRDCHVLIRGNHRKAGKLAPRAFLEVLAGKDQPAIHNGSGRLELADRMIESARPLMARVIVNRLWHHHFGRGLVATPDDFGHMGQPPTHPELLDWLAGELLRQNGSLKAMHRLMVLSAAYRMSSRADDPRAEQVDADNRLLHRMRPKRLEGEIIRDAILHVSGRLDERMEGPGVLPYLTPFMEGRGRPSRSGPLDGAGRRSIYIQVRRNFLPPMFLAFDFPTPMTTVGRRSVSNVPAQALILMNNPFVVSEARRWSQRMQQEGPPSREERIAWLYEMAFGRLPTQAETDAAVAFLDEQLREYGQGGTTQAWADLCHVLLNVKEFVFIR